MAARKSVVIDEVFDETPAVEVLDNAFGRYSHAVIAARAIPDVRDGLKPVHRKIMFALHKMKRIDPQPYEKVASISGFVMSNLHPHGDASINDAIAVLSQEWVQRVPLVSIEGNNGSVDGDGAAAARYIEARGTKAGGGLLEGLGTKDTVPLNPTYKGDSLEPVVLPAPWPTLFTNGSFGIAVGLSSNIPPHNPIELLKAARYMNKNEGATLKKIMSFVPAPDFPTGGVVVVDDSTEKMYCTGAGCVVLRGCVVTGKNTVTITRIPYGITRTALKASISDAVDKAGIGAQFVSMDDMSDSDVESNIVITLRRGVDPETVASFLFAKTKMSLNVHMRAVCLVDGHPRTVGLVEYLREFVRFRRECVRRPAGNALGVARARLHVVDGLIRMSEFPDEVIRVVKSSTGKDDSIGRLQSELGFTMEQATAIAMLRLYRISRQDVAALVGERDELRDTISYNERLLSDDAFLVDVVDGELKNTIKSFSRDPRSKRLTRVVGATEVEDNDVDVMDLKKAEPTLVAVTPLSAQRMTKQMFDNGKDKAPSRIVTTIDATTTDALIVLTRGGVVMQRIVEDLPHSSIRNSVDAWSKTTPSFDMDDHIVAAVTAPMSDINGENTYLDSLMVVSVTRLGQVKKNKLRDVLLSFNSKGYLTRTKVFNGLKLRDDEIIAVAVIPENNMGGTQLSLRRASGGRVTKIDMVGLSTQGAAGSGTNHVKITKPGDGVTITTHNFDKTAVSYWVAE